ncbi:serine/threonine-protein kinase [Streptomyces sp. NBRC 109706]|uniref:serine/threonine-protein kinase n=1 Tax=Streptomyces sp. NBRC 109706 TaxID=1550035 RepID=UPI00078112C8|nr:serine/threonine-protein kinase [Streptomyces sp. NBRC 109706]
MAEGELLGGRYRLIRVVGSGGMGVVHEARDEMLGRRVAIKRLHRSVGDGSVDMRRFEREMRALARIRHPNVVTLHDVGAADGQPHLVLEWVPGADLSQLLREHGTLSAEATRAVVIGVAEALGAAHRAGVLHRDVKPSNVQIDMGGRVVLGDFGLARLAEDSTVTQTGAFVGSPGYMAPEVIQGQPPLPASDFYGLGICLHQMLTGRHPLGGSDEIGVMIMRAVVEGVPPLALDDPRRLATDLVELANGLTRRDPAARPSTSQEILERLTEADPRPGTDELWRLMALSTLRRSRPGGGRPSGAPGRPAGGRSWDTAGGPDGPAGEPAGEPEYLDVAPETLVVDGPGKPDGEGLALQLGSPPAAGDSSPEGALSLSDVTRSFVLSRITPANAVSRLREAVGMVRRGEIQQAVDILSTIDTVCSERLGPDHPTTLTAQFWHGVCLARLGAGSAAIALFSHVNAHTEPGGSAETDTDPVGEREGMDSDQRQE